MLPLIKHIHADLILEKARQDATGETAAVWWVWSIRRVDGGWDRLTASTSPSWNNKVEYRYSRTSSHPHFVPPKPELKLVDMSKLPKGSWVTTASMDFIVLGPQPHTIKLLRTLSHANYVVYAWPEAVLRITEQKEFTYWGGGACPVPDGVRVEVVLRRRYGQGDRAPTTEFIYVDRNTGTTHWPHDGTDSDIIAYRILGLAYGWTDDPELVK